jgi:hypothetical protein
MIVARRFFSSQASKSAAALTQKVKAGACPLEAKNLAHKQRKGESAR